MEEKKLKIEILPNSIYLKSNGTFDKDEAIKLSGKIAGVCYDKEGFSHLVNEPEEKTSRRIDLTINNGHHSVYDHTTISFNIQNLPKILAMFINNENQYTTSEKSARYTPIEAPVSVLDNLHEISKITEKEVDLYNKWMEIFKSKIKDKYGDIYNDSKIKKLAQENARYLITVFMPTQMIYTTSLRQINYIASWMKNYIEDNKNKNEFETKVANSMKEFLSELDRLNVLDERLMRNEKQRHFSLFAKDLDRKEVHYGDVYSTLYKGSFAQLAQAQRHRTLNYQAEMLDEKEYFVPPIIEDEPVLVNEWLNDMNSVKNVNPQGELVKIYEMGNYDNFILKCKERLCTAAQLEIMLQTKKTLEEYKKALEESNNYLYDNILNYTHGAKCTFNDCKCTEPCHFKEGINLTRKI